MTTQEAPGPLRGWLAALVRTPGIRQRGADAPGHRVTPPRPRLPQSPDAEQRVQFRRVMSMREFAAFALMLAGVTWLTARYAIWWFDADHLPANYRGAGAALVIAANVVPFAALTLLEGLRMLQMLVFWFFACFMADAVPLAPPLRMRVAILTTIVPSKEPPELVEPTLAAMSRIRYRGPIDLWILDEEDDPRVHALAQRYGVLHFTRHNIARYNQRAGQFVARTKSGNLNAWLDNHHDRYDVVGQMDSDHVASPAFLEDTLGYFRDPDVGYVVAPQVYARNAAVNWIARGSDEQNFGFSAITQRGANRLGMPILIGSNHLVRTSMMRQLDGYVSHLVEDHITGMLAMSKRNPVTGGRWRGVYTRSIISHGEGPATWAAYFAQQMRWSFGLFEILRRSTPRLIWKLRPAQAVGLLLIQSYYPSVAGVFGIGVALTSLQLFTGVSALDVSFGEWSRYWLPPSVASMALWYWMQRFFLTPADRGVGVRGMLLGVGASLIYLQAMLAALAGRRLPYVITPKGQHAQREPLALFRWHAFVLVLSVLALAWAVTHDVGLGTLRFWAAMTAVLMALVIASGVLIRPREEARVVRPRVVGGRYWARVAVPTAALAVLLLVIPRVAPATSSPGVIASEITVGAIVEPGVERAAPRPVAARFLSADEPGVVALGAFDPWDTLGPIAKIRHVFIDFRPERSAEMRAAVEMAARQNQVTMITWEPRRSIATTVAPRPSDQSVLAEILEGGLDGYLREAARSLRDSGQPVILRFAHEMDLAPDGSHPWSGGDPQVYIAAWRHVHDIFESELATNVQFLWSPGGVLDRDTFVSQLWYPGGDTVDLVGFSAFASWQWEPGAPDASGRPAFRSPEELVMPRYRAIARFVKPVILPEVGLEMHPDRLDEERGWLDELSALVSGPDVPLLRGVVYFNAPHNLPNYDIDWRLRPAEIEVLHRAWIDTSRFETSISHEDAPSRAAR